MASVATNRRYGDGCAIATALDYVGERWALLVVRELLLGPKRFTDLQDGLPHAGAKILAQRLRELEGIGVIHRRVLPPPASSQVYELTDWGAQLDPVVNALGRWAVNGAVMPQGDVGADSAMLRLRDNFEPQPGREWSATYEIRLGRNRFTVRIVDGRLGQVARGEPQERPDAVIDTDSNTLDELVGKEQTLRKALKEGRLTITGDTDAVDRLLAA